MGIAKLYGQSGSGGFKPNGIIQDYYVYAGERIEKGDFVELLTGSNGDEKETQVRKATTSDIYGVAKTSGMGAYKIVDYTVEDGESVSEGGNREYSIKTTIQENIVINEWKTANKVVYTASDVASKSNSFMFAANAFNGKFDDEGSRWQSAIDTSEHWLKLEFTDAITITKMGIIMDEYDGVAKAVIQGSNNDSSWKTLSSSIPFYDWESTPSSLDEVVLNNSTPYKYYRVYITNATSKVQIWEWQITEYLKISSYTGIALQSGTAGDTIQIAVPVSDEESTGHKDMIKVYQPYPEKRLVMADGNILTTSNGDVFLLKEAI